MATVKLSYTFADGDQIASEVKVATSYPDAVSEARAEAVRAFTEAMTTAAVVLMSGDRDDEDES